MRAVWEDSSFADMDEAIRDYLAHEGYPTILAPGGELAARIVAGDDLTSKSPLLEIPNYAGRPLAIVHGEADTLLQPALRGGAARRGERLRRRPARVLAGPRHGAHAGGDRGARWPTSRAWSTTSPARWARRNRRPAPVSWRRDTARRDRPGRPARVRARGPLGRPDPRARRAGAVGQPVAAVAAGRIPGRAVPRHPRDDPVREGQLAPELGHGIRRVAGRPRVRALPPRRPGHRQLARRRARRVHRGRDARRVRRRRVAGGPAVVQRQRRDVGHQLRRVHRDPGRQAPAAAPPGHPADVRDRRPLSRRRPPPRRLHHREREEPVRGQPARDERAAAAAVVPWRRVARRVAGAARGDAAVARSRGSASRPTGRTGAGGRWPRTTRRSSAPCSRWPAGATPTSTRRSGSRSDASTRSGGPSSATGSTRSRTTPTRARTSTGCASSSGSSTTTSAASTTAGSGSRR